MRRGPHAAGGRSSYADCFVVCRLLSCYRPHSCIWLHSPPARYLRATHLLCAQLCSCRLSACTCHTTTTLTNDLVVAGTFYDARSLSCHPRRQHPLRRSCRLQLYATSRRWCRGCRGHTCRSSTICSTTGRFCRRCRTRSQRTIVAQKKLLSC